MLVGCVGAIVVVTVVRDDLGKSRRLREVHLLLATESAELENGAIDNAGDSDGTFIWAESLLDM